MKLFICVMLFLWALETGKYLHISVNYDDYNPKKCAKNIYDVAFIISTAIFIWGLYVLTV